MPCTRSSSGFEMIFSKQRGGDRDVDGDGDKRGNWGLDWACTSPDLDSPIMQLFARAFSVMLIAISVECVASRPSSSFRDVFTVSSLVRSLFFFVVLSLVIFSLKIMGSIRQQGAARGLHVPQLSSHVRSLLSFLSPSSPSNQSQQRRRSLSSHANCSQQVLGATISLAPNLVVVLLFLSLQHFTFSNSSPSLSSLLRALTFAEATATVAPTSTVTPTRADDDDPTKIGDVVLTTENEVIGRIAKESLIAAAITVAFLIPYIFDQLMMKNSATRYNGRKVDAIVGRGGGGASSSASSSFEKSIVVSVGASGKEIPPCWSSLAHYSPPPFLPIGISSHLFHAGYPIDGPREYLIYAKVNKRLLEQQQQQQQQKGNTNSNGNTNTGGGVGCGGISDSMITISSSGNNAGEGEGDTLDLGPKPFANALFHPSAGDGDEGRDTLPLQSAGDRGGGVPVVSTIALAPRVGYPPLIRNYHRRVDPAYAESVLCCLDEGMEMRLPPVPIGEISPPCAEGIDDDVGAERGITVADTVTEARSGASYEPPAPTVPTNSSFSGGRRDGGEGGGAVANTTAPIASVIDIDDVLGGTASSPPQTHTTRVAIHRQQQQGQHGIILDDNLMIGGGGGPTNSNNNTNNPGSSAKAKTSQGARKANNAALAVEGLDLELEEVAILPNQRQSVTGGASRKPSQLRPSEAAKKKKSSAATATAGQQGAFTKKGASVEL